MIASITEQPASFIHEKRRIEKAGRLNWFHWLILLGSLIVTLMAWQYARTQNQAQISNQFDREARQVVDLISERMTKYEDILWSAVAAKKAHGDIMSLQEWQRYSESQKIHERYPGINGIGLIEYVPADKLTDYLAQQRMDRPDFRMHPAHDKGEYLPITYVEPVDMNAAAIGLDIAHEDNRYNAALKARDTGKAQITGPIVLVQDAKRTPGFLFYAPFYDVDNPASLAERRETFLGMTYAPFIFERLMQGTHEIGQRRVGVKIVDGGDVLFDERLKTSESGQGGPMFSTEIAQNIYGRKWTFSIWSQPSFEKTAVNNKPLIILASGLIIETLLIGLFFFLARANRRAMSFAQQMSDAEQAQAARLENILENAVDGIMTIRADGEIHNYNKACADIFGYSGEDIIGENVDLLIPEFPEAYALIRSGNDNPDEKTSRAPRELVGRRHNGLLVPLEVSVSEINDEGHLLYNTIVRDITRRKKAEDERNRAMEDLILSNQDLEKFAYSASHDLKSPLRAIDSLSRWIEEDLGEKIDAENQDRLQKLRGRVARMENMLNGLLQYSRAGQSVTSTEKLSAAALLEDIIETINVPEGFKVNIDENLKDISIARMPLEQIFHNLVNNAIKHHDRSEGEIRISAEQKGPHYIFSINDDGPGIPEEFHEKIFEMFQTLKPKDSVEGSGLGLALVKKLVHHHDGKIRIIPDGERGSTFELTWPIAQREKSFGKNADTRQSA